MNDFGYFGLTDSASLDDLNEAFRKRSLATHPDRGGDVQEFKVAQGHYDAARKQIEGVTDDPMGDLCKAFDALRSQWSSTSESRDLSDPEMWKRFPYICNHCGYIAGTTYGTEEDGIFVHGNLSSWHYYASPECWEKEQARLKAQYEHERQQDQDRPFGHQWGFRRCSKCGRDMYVHFNCRSHRCPYCVKATILANRRHKRKTPARICETCGEAFQPKRKDARYCSAACRQKSYRKRVTDNNQYPQVTDRET